MKKGIVLAGGSGSRLGLLTRSTNKHLLPIGDKPMVCYPILKLVESGIKDIMVICGTEHLGSMAQFLGSGRDFGCRITMRAQDEAGGIAQAVGLAEDFCHNEDKFCVLLGDNVFEDSLLDYIDDYEKKDGAYVLLKRVQDPERFGVATVEKGKITKIVEKPNKPESNYIVTGIYMYTTDVFDVIKGLKPSNRGELEISEVNDYYVREGKMHYSVLEGWWTDSGTYKTLFYANVLVSMNLR